jgi:hypothetical protein
MKITLNIGLEINETKSEAIEQQIADTVAACLQLAVDALLIEVKVEPFAFVGKSGENTLHVELHLLQALPVFRTWLHALSIVLQQDCIAYRCDADHDLAELIGPKASEWGAFDPDHFGQP